jgi:hypothetical protein
MTKKLPQSTSMELPADISVYVLNTFCTPKERAKLRNYVRYGDTFYQSSDDIKEKAYAILAERHAISVGHLKTRLQEAEEVLHAELHELLVALKC